MLASQHECSFSPANSTAAGAKACQLMSSPALPCRDVAHALDRTFLISLLQPAPEVVHLFDDILLLTDGRVIYQ